MMTMLLRAFLNQKICGVITLQLTIIQYAQLYGPNARLMKAKDSYSSPLYHAMKNSIVYAYPTIEPVNKMILHMFSR